MHRFSGNGMREIQLPGMKCLTADQIPTGIIKKISDKRMPQILHMNPDLMCAACFQPQSDQGYIFLCIVEDRFVMGDSRKGQILRPTPNTAPLICGACNTQPKGL